MESPVGIMPAALLASADKAAVIAWLVPLPLPSVSKVKLFRAWSQLLGVTPTAYDYQLLEFSGLPRGRNV